MNAENFQTSFPIILIQFSSVYFQWFFPIFFSLIDFPTFFLYIRQFIIAFGILLILINFLEIIIFGLIELIGQQMNISLIFNVSH